MSHAVFVNGLSLDPDLPVRKGQLKQFHRKSRTGCQRCRTRRIKCNEAKPICGKCERAGLLCTYDRLSQEGSRRAKPDGCVGGSGCQRQASRDIGLSGMASVEGHLDEAGSPNECVSEPAETKRRRIQELELMHFYITETGPSIAFDQESSQELFVKAIPRMALKSDALLYSVYAFAALHRARTTTVEDPSTATPPAMPAPLEGDQIYMQLAFQRHHEELARFSSDSVDVLLMTAHLMRIIAFVVLSERNLEPYTPPLEWLRITSSHARIFSAAWDLVGDETSTQVAKMIRSTPIVWDLKEREGANKRQRLQHILLAQDKEDDPKLWDAEVRGAYESTLSYIGGIWQAMQKREPSGPIRRRLILFPMLVRKPFIELVGKGRPRALVVLAHYFALVTSLKSFWFVGNTGAREVRAIAAHLPPQWQGFMDLPLRIIKDPERLLYSSTVDS